MFHLSPSGAADPRRTSRAEGCTQGQGGRSAIHPGYECRWIPRRPGLETWENQASQRVTPDSGHHASASRWWSVSAILIFAGKSLETCSRRSRETAIIGTEMKTVIDLAAPGTELDVITWYNDSDQDNTCELKLALGGHEAGVTVNVLSDGSNGPAVVVVTVFHGGHAPRRRWRQRVAPADPKQVEYTDSTLRSPPVLGQKLSGQLDARREADGQGRALTWCTRTRWSPPDAR